MDDLGVPFNSISVVSGRLKGGHERRCAMKRHLGSGRFSPPAGFEPAIPWSEVGIFKATKHKLSKGVLRCDILEAHFSSYFVSIYSSAGHELCTLTARRRIVLNPPSQALSIVHKFPSWTSSSLYYTTSKIVAIQVMIFTQFTGGKYGKSDLQISPRKKLFFRVSPRNTPCAK